MMNAVTEFIAHPAHLWWLFLVPVLWLVYFLSQKRMRRRRTNLGAAPTVRKMLTVNVSTKAELAWVSAAILCFIIALANPRSGTKREKATAKAADILIALDISNSMNAADISPARMEKARTFLSDFIQSRKGDQIGLIFFAGEAYLQMPLSRDYAAADMFVRSATTSMAGSQGTAIGEAIDMAMDRTKDRNPRALVIVTDGEDHDNDALTSARKAADQGWTIYPIGVGTMQGGLVPESADPGAPLKMQYDGSPVTSRLNETLLKDIAKEGRGKYYLLGDEADLVTTLGAELEKIGKREMEVRSFTEYESYYQYALFAGVVCVILSFIFPFLKRQNKENDGW